MHIETARMIYDAIKSTRMTELRDDLIQDAVRYARLRVDWQLATGDERKQIDEVRTRAHDAFISSCNILSRAMLKNGEDVSWREQLGPDRKEIGDWACWMHAFMGISAR